MPLLQNNTGFFKAYFYTISTTILSSSKFQFVMEISKKKPFSYIRLELWVSEKRTTAKRGSTYKNESASAELGQEGPYGHRQGWEQCGCEALALALSPPGALPLQRAAQPGLCEEPNSPEGGVSSQGHCFPWPNII